MHRSWFGEDWERALQVETRNDKTVVSYWEVQQSWSMGYSGPKRRGGNMGEKAGPHHTAPVHCAGSLDLEPKALERLQNCCKQGSAIIKLEFWLMVLAVEWIGGSD